MPIQSVNPATEQVIATFSPHTPQQIEAALDGAVKVFASWRKTAFAERARPMRAAGAYLRANKTRLAAMATAEMGKTIGEADAEVEKCAWNCDYYAENAEAFLKPRHIASTATESYVQYEPLGTLLAIMPWNFPFWQAFRAACPAMMAGNAVILKHASNVSQCALAIEEAFRAAGFPSGLFRTLLVPGAAIEPLIGDSRIHAVTITRADSTGSRVAELSGKSLKKTVMELGGSDPFIVLRDADLEQAAAVGARARNQNAGQSCIAAKRFIVEEAVAADFERLFVKAVRDLKVGDPMDRSVNIGPLARGDLRDELHSQVKRALDVGAKLLLGGEPPKGKGYFYEPTILTNVTPGMSVFREETFGPVAAIAKAKDAAEAVRLANDSVFGRGAALWTREIARAKELSRSIESGQVFINGMVASDPRLPFGGVKRSGYGRELSDVGIREFVNIQTLWIGPAVAPPPKIASE